MKQLFIAAAAAMALPAIAAVSATNSLAQSSLGGQAQRAAADVNMDAVPLLTPDSIRKVQQALQKKGVNPGPIDGKFGPMTKQAVHNFQDRYGIKSTGDVDNQTLFALGEVDLAGD